MLPNNRTRTSTWNMVFGYINTIVLFVRNILMVPLYLHYVSIEEYGAWMATGFVLINLIVIDFGLAGVTIQRVSYLLGKGEKNTLNASIGTSLLSGVVLALVLSLACLSVAGFVPELMSLDGDVGVRVYECFLLAILSNAILIVAIVALGIVKSLNAPIRAGIVGPVSDIVSLIVTVLLLINGFGLYSIPLGLLTKSFLMMILGVFYCLSICIVNYGILPTISLSELKTMFKNTTQIFFTSIFMKLQIQTDTFFVGVFLGPQNAAVYGLTIRGYEVVKLIVSQVGYSVAPSLANLYGENSLSNFKNVILRITIILIFFAGVGVTCFAILNESFVTLWVGAELYAGNATTILLALAGFIFMTNSIAYDTLVASAKFKLISKIYASTVLVHLASLILLMKYVGLWSIPIAHLLSASLFGGCFWRYVILHYKFKSLDFNKIIYSYVSMIVISLVFIIASIYFEAIFNSWLELIAGAVTLIIAICVSVFLCVSSIRKVVLKQAMKSFNALISK